MSDDKNEIPFPNDHNERPKITPIRPDVDPTGTGNPFLDMMSGLFGSMTGAMGSLEKREGAQGRAWQLLTARYAQTGQITEFDAHRAIDATLLFERVWKERNPEPTDATAAARTLR